MKKMLSSMVNGTDAGDMPPNDAKKWRTRPAMLRMACGEHIGRQEAFNDPASAFPIETDSFEGRMYVRFRACGPVEDKEYFAGKNRKMSCCVQGRFKRAVLASECWNGYQFERRFQNVPARWIINGALKVIRKLAPTMKADLLGERPYVLNPLLQTVQVLDVSKPGDEPSITSRQLVENTALLGGSFAQRAVDRSERKDFFAEVRNGEQHTLSPEYVFTFEFYEDKLDPATYEVAIMGMRFGLAKYLDRQPLHYFAKLGAEAHTPHAPTDLWHVEFWHERLLEGEGSAEQRAVWERWQWRGATAGPLWRQAGRQVVLSLRTIATWQAAVVAALAGAMDVYDDGSLNVSPLGALDIDGNGVVADLDGDGTASSMEMLTGVTLTAVAVLSASAALRRARSSVVVLDPSTVELVEE